MSFTNTARDWRGETRTVTVPRGTLLHSDALCGVYLVHVGARKFVVVYGLQVSAPLNYAEAAREYGRCIMHALACNGTL